MSKDTFVIYDRKTNEILEIRLANGQTNRQYYSIGAARAVLTRFCKKSGLLPTDDGYPQYKFGFAEREYYNKHIGKINEKAE